MQLDTSQATLDNLLGTCTNTVGTQIIENGFTPDMIGALAGCDVAAIAQGCAAELAAAQGTRADTALGNATSVTAAPAGVQPGAPSGAGARVVAHLVGAAAVIVAAALAA